MVRLTLRVMESHSAERLNNSDNRSVCYLRFVERLHFFGTQLRPSIRSTSTFAETINLVYYGKGVLL
jgi:hypothetical protein